MAAADAPFHDNKSNRHPNLAALNAQGAPTVKAGAAAVVPVEIATAMMTISCFIEPRCKVSGPATVGPL